MNYKPPTYLLAILIGFLLLPLGAAHAAFILNVDSTAKEFSFTGSAPTSPTSSHATWTTDGALLDVYMDSPGPSRIATTRKIRDRSGVGLKEAKTLVDTAPGNIFFNRSPGQASGDLSAMRALSAVVSPRIAASLGATSFSFTGPDGSAMNLHLADNGLVVDLALSQAITSSLFSPISSVTSPATSYASATPSQQAFLESIDMSLSLLDGTGFGELQAGNATVVPEPTSAALFLGLASMFGINTRRR